jgi:hypothetical protein
MFGLRKRKLQIIHFLSSFVENRESDLVPRIMRGQSLYRQFWHSGTWSDATGLRELGRIESFLILFRHALLSNSVCHLIQACLKLCQFFKAK